MMVHFLLALRGRLGVLEVGENLRKQSSQKPHE